MEDRPGRIESDTDVEARTRDIRQDIESTREDISETVEAIQERLAPRRVLSDATEGVKTAATDRLRQMTGTAGETTQQAFRYSRDAAQDAVHGARDNWMPLALMAAGAGWLWSNRSRRSSYTPTVQYRMHRSSGSHPAERLAHSEEYETANDWTTSGADDEWTRRQRRTKRNGLESMIRENPVAAGLTGIGLGWMMVSYRNRDRERYEGWSESSSRETGSLMTRTKEMGSDTAQSIRTMARQRQSQVNRLMQTNPLLIGASALLLGAAIGGVVPETEIENEWMGDTRDNLVESARDMASEATSQIQDVASGVTNAAKKLGGTGD